MLSQATSYRGAHLRRDYSRVDPPRDASAGLPLGAGEGGARASPSFGAGEAGEDDGGDGDDDVRVVNVDIDIDGVENVSLISTPQRQRRQQPSSPPPRERARKEESMSKQYKMHDDDDEVKKYEAEEQGRLERDRMIARDRERERDQLFLEEHRGDRRGAQVSFDDDDDDGAGYGGNFALAHDIRMGYVWQGLSKVKGRSHVFMNEAAQACARSSSQICTHAVAYEYLPLNIHVLERRSQFELRAAL